MKKFLLEEGHPNNLEMKICFKQSQPSLTYYNMKILLIDDKY